MKRLLFVVLMVTCSVSWAEWEITYRSIYGKVFHDKSTISREGVISKMWVLTEFSSLQSFQESEKKDLDEIGEAEKYTVKYKSTKNLMVFNCQEKMMAGISGARYSGSMGKGEVIITYEIKESELVWESVGAHIKPLWKIACGKQAFNKKTQ